MRADTSKEADAPYSLNETEKQQLLDLAHKSVESAVLNRLYSPESTTDSVLNQGRGAFVTLKKGGNLRGCIGLTAPTQPLYMTVRDTAMWAALRDPRFQPVAVSELSQLQYEISVLSPLRRVRDVREIQVGKHGLLMKNADREGLLLPQVPVEQHWDRTTFLQQTCVKAGIAPDCWKDEDTDIFEFTAVVFGDPQPTTATSLHN